MKQLRQFLRLLHINFILFRYGFDQIVFSIPWLYPFRFLSLLNPWNWQRNKNKSRGERLRLILEALGPIFVKFGQVLSTRRDLVPEDIALELASLQDRVPPFAKQEVTSIIEKAYQQPIADVFLSFDEQPLASASIAQVHKATLPDNKEVVVKVLRPNIKKLIERDVALLYTLAKLFRRHSKLGKRLKPVDLVAEFERSIFDELDLTREGANASQLRRNFANNKNVYIPEIYWPYARKKVLVMERISGIPIANIDALKAAGINMKKLAERGIEIFFTQVFRDSFFHADMHPGNLFVSKEHPDDPQFILVDFGIIGTLNATDQRYLAENFLAFFKRDYRRVAELHVASGWVAQDTRVDDLEAAIRIVCEPIFAKPLKDISCGQLLMRLFQTAKRFKMNIQPQFLLLQKTLLNIEGLGRSLYPELDLWATGRPYLEALVKDQVGPKALAKRVMQNMPFWVEKMPETPELFYQFLKQVPLNTAPQQTNTHESQQATQSQYTALSYSCLGVAVSCFAVNLLLPLPSSNSISLNIISFVSLVAAYLLK